MDQNSLYELTSEYGEVYGVALPRESYLLKTIDSPNNWLNVSDIIGTERAHQLAKNEVVAQTAELKALIRWQVDNALNIADANVTPVIWLCNISDTGEVIAVESWDESLSVELKFRLIGKYQSKSTAIEDLERHYIFDEFEI
jgi:hypothetical protein